MVMQDMPSAVGLVPEAAGDPAPGRIYYEECLDSMLERDANHPSIFSVVLFNETWGLKSAYQNENTREIKASDGKSTSEWVSYLYYHVKDVAPQLLVEDMSPNHNDHVQPTDLNSYHTYPDKEVSAREKFSEPVKNAFPGSAFNFAFGYQQDGDPLINSEYGGLQAYGGEYDISYCFKYQTDIQCSQLKQSGLCYTQAYDVEYERNGLYTADRKRKEMGYSQIAYGSDMTIRDLVGDIYIGFPQQKSITTALPGQKIRVSADCICWIRKLPDKVVLKWKFTADDEQGQSFLTGISGKKSINLQSYHTVHSSIDFRLPQQNCVGTLTVWLEDGNGYKLAKNFTQFIVRGESPSYTGINDSHILKIRTKNKDFDKIEKTGSLSYEVSLPENTDIDSISKMTLLFEASSFKGGIGSDKNSADTHSMSNQTTEGLELPSVVTVRINGIKIETVRLEDNPRDMRAALSLLNPLNKGSSAGDYGYMNKIVLTEDVLKKLKQQRHKDGTLTVTLSVDSDSPYPNGLKLYSAESGRYMADPQIILNQNLPSEKAYLNWLIRRKYLPAFLIAAASIILCINIFRKKRQ